MSCPQKQGAGSDDSSQLAGHELVAISLPPSTVPELWAEIRRLCAQLHEKDAEREAHFYAPASQNEIARLEEVLGAPIPDDLRTSLLCCNGAYSLWDALEMHSTSGIVSGLKVFDESFQLDADLRPIGPVSTRFFGKYRIPIGSGPEGDTYCLDLMPEPGGAVGQIVYIAWELWKIEVLTSSFVEFLHLGIGRLRQELTEDA